MLSEREERLSEESGPEEKDSVYDFLYQDARRIGSFLAQFERYGHLQSLTSTSSFVEDEGTSYDTGGSIGVPSIMGLQAGGHGQEKRSHSQMAARTYDPLWQNSLALLDYLEQRDYLCRDLSGARIGEFTLVSGTMTLFDMSMMKAIMLTKHMSNVITKAIFEGEDVTLALKSKSSTERAGYGQAAQALIKELPFGFQVHLRGKDFGVWASLRAQNLELNMEDLMLKHGAVIAGEWNMLGILDALPDSDVKPDFSFFGEDELGKHVAELFTNMRPKLGRPNTSHGMTPLLIFREVSSRRNATS